MLAEVVLRHFIEIKCYLKTSQNRHKLFVSLIFFLILNFLMTMNRVVRKMLLFFHAYVPTSTAVPSGFYLMREE